MELLIVDTYLVRAVTAITVVRRWPHVEHSDNAIRRMMYGVRHIGFVSSRPRAIATRHDEESSTHDNMPQCTRERPFRSR